jgi:hypothetical protein
LGLPAQQPPPGAAPATPRAAEPADDPQARDRFRAAQEESGGGLSPAEARLQALAAVENLRQAQPAGARTAGIPTGARVVPWRLAARTAGLRPGALGWASLGPDAGGRTRAIVIHPANPKHMLAASPAGGVWVTQDAGQHWEPADDFMANLAVNCLAADPARPDTVYAGTGEGFRNVDSIRGQGLFRSTDAGKTWAPLKATAGFPYVNRIAVSADGRTVLPADGERQ